MAKRAGFILCVVVCALGVGASYALAAPPPHGVMVGAVAVDVQVGTPVSIISA